ncbi:MAG: hypothetical protein IKW83_07195 [Muribaculaceae bacterium]|nr:hypothetical protein [Muribaculaceae bacterium]
METAEYQKQRDEILNRPMCFREAAVEDIEALDDKHYKVAGMTVEVIPDVARRLDKYIGTNSQQVGQVKRYYGEYGATNLRNYLGRSVKPGKKVVLQANATTGKVTGVERIGEHMIVPQTFFDFADMFMDRNNYLPHKMEFRDNRIHLMLEATNPQYHSLLKGDDVLSNGIMLSWQPGQMAVSNFYVRLVCSNGMTRVIDENVARTSTATPQVLTEMLYLPDNQLLMSTNLSTLQEKVIEAARCRASLREMKTAKEILLSNGVDDVVAEEYVPYKELVKEYKEAGHRINAKNRAYAEGNQNVWELYNNLTEFATHNHEFTSHDPRRTSILIESMNLLDKERDLKPRLTLNS